MRRPFAVLAFAGVSVLAACSGSTGASTVSHPDDAGPEDAALPHATDSGSPVVPDAATGDSGAPDATTGDGSAPKSACVPGQSIGCVGPGGCSTNQVCSADGSGFGPCACVGDGSAASACVPGQSIACGGPGGCTSFQVCAADGSGYGACNCPDAGSGGDAAAEGDGGDSGEGGSRWTPAQLPGLVLWLDDTYGMTIDPQHPGTLIHWLDRSGRGNDATLTGSYYSVNGGVAFAYAGYGLDPSVVNGLNAVSCPIEQYEYATPTFTVPSSADFALGTGDFGVVMVVENIGTGWSSTGLAVNESTMTVEGQSVSVAAPPTARFAYVIARGGTTSSLDVDGVIATGGANAQALPASAVTFCPSSGGDIAEVIAVKGTLSDGDVGQVTAYLKAKFGI